MISFASGKVWLRITMAVMTPQLTHFAINTDDVEATQSFYGSVFGWQFQEYGSAGFVQIIDEATQQPMVNNAADRSVQRDDHGNGAWAG